MTASRPTPPIAAVSALIALVACLLLTAFAWPAVHTAPNHLPLAVVAPAPALAQLQSRLDAARPGAFELRAVADEAEARQAILSREVYGALLLTSGTPKVLTASAASPAAAQLLAQLPTLLSPTTPSAVEDIMPASAADPRQAGLAGAALPLVFSGMFSAVMLTRLYRSARTRVTGLMLVALLAGLGITAILQLWFGTLAGSYLLNSLVVSLGVAAIGAFIFGLEAVLGFVGLGLGGATMLLLGNSFSALGGAPELLPSSWGAFGQLLPPGAFGTLLRSVAFFDGAGWQTPTLTLGVWVVAGLSLVIVGSAQRRRSLPVGAQAA